MQKPSASLIFPFKVDDENSCLLRATTIEDTLMSAIRCFLVTRKGSRVGNNIGSFLPELLLQTIPTSALQGFASELRDELTQQFDGVEFLNVTMSMDKSDNVSSLIVVITFTTAIQSSISELTISMPSVFDSSNTTPFQKSL
jgi:phage baseplate assembly protein W